MGARRAHLPSRRRARRNPPGRWKPGGILTAVTAGIIGAIVALLALPVMFGVPPVDLMRGEIETTRNTGQKAGEKEMVEMASLSSGEADVATIAREVIPSIVNIDVRSRVQGFRRYDQGIVEGAGSGVIYSEDGYIITNDHVVGSAETITVTFSSGEQSSANLVGTDPGSDIAVIKVEKFGLPAVRLGDSDKLAVGEPAVAIGSPYGFEQSVTSGIISALDRRLTVQNISGRTVELTGLLQTDASINPGNSGGALCDSRARLIGVATLIASSSGGSEGVGFAVPVNRVRRVADAIIGGRPVEAET